MSQFSNLSLKNFEAESEKQEKKNKKKKRKNSFYDNVALEIIFK